MSFTRIDMEAYKRRSHFDYFRTLACPYVGVTVNVDVTSVIKYAKASGRSFYLSFIHASALAADKIPELRQRIRDNGIVEYYSCPTSHTEANPDGTYRYCTLKHHMELNEYFSKAEQARLTSLDNGINEDDDVESMYFVSSLPWLNYSSLAQPVGGGNDSNPRISWGRYEEAHSGKVVMPVSILAHHALVDGIHLAGFYDNLILQIKEFEKYV